MFSRWNKVAVFAFVSMVSVALVGQTTIGIDQPYAGDRNVTGQCVPGTAPLTVYEVAGTARNYLGKSSSVDQQGYYAVAVSPPLVNGQNLIVVDSQGRSSRVSLVIVKTGPAGPGQ